MNEFVASCREAAASWLKSTSTIPQALRVPGNYRRWEALPFCLPIEARSFNLLPEARELALERFAAASIPWHDGTPGLPSNHLLSSQVQCANALAPFVADPAALAWIFGGVLKIDEVLPFKGIGPAATSFDWNDHVVFEWPGASDYLGERLRVPRARGANTTSVDAAIRYRTTDGTVAIALVEWKFTENYKGRVLSGGSNSMKVRKLRYGGWWSPTGPLRTDLLRFEDILVEPVYQLFRLHCLAQEMQRAGEGGATKVTVVYAAPTGNRALLGYFPGPASRRIEAEDGLLTGWRDLLYEPQSFQYLDTSSLLRPASVMSEEYRRRYGAVVQGDSSSP